MQNGHCGVNSIIAAKELGMTNVTITLPDDLAEIAQELGLLTTPVLEAYICGNIKVNIDDLDYPSDSPFL